MARPASVGQLAGLHLQLVQSDDDRLAYHRLLADEHPQGAVCHVGYQLRYLVRSDHGILDCVGFATSAHALADRDQWIGWDPSTRRQQLHRLRRLPDDFQLRYGFEPLLLETFVDASSHDGTCFKATNWIALGHSADGLDRDRWAALEFGSAPVGDVRLTRCLALCASVLADSPMASFPSAAQGDRALGKGWYRLLDHPAESELTPENILATHRERSLGRLQAQDTVVCLQDGTDLNFAEHGGCVGRGKIGCNKGLKGTLGLHLHSTPTASEFSWERWALSGFEGVGGNLAGRQLDRALVRFPTDGCGGASWSRGCSGPGLAGPWQRPIAPAWQTCGAVPRECCTGS